MRKTVIALIIAAILAFGYLISILLTPNIVGYAQVHIRPDGTIEPTSTPITHDGNIYTLQKDITLDNLSIEKNNITLDGKGFSLRINGGLTKAGPTVGALKLSNIENVTFRNLNFTLTDLIFENSSFCKVQNSFCNGIEIVNSRNIFATENDMSTKDHFLSVKITNSAKCTISSCTMYGASLINSHENSILNNIMIDTKRLGVKLENSSNNLFFGNSIEKTMQLFDFTGASTNNLFVGNYIRGAFNFDTILNCSGVNTFYHNNLIYVYWNQNSTSSANMWDNGFEGNYWNDYQGTDSNQDGIGDTPHQVDYNNIDRYPLMQPLDLSKEPQPNLPK